MFIKYSLHCELYLW